MKLAELVAGVLENRRQGDILPIQQIGHAALRRRSQRFEGQLDDALLAELIHCMVATMRDAPGVGLAAPQVGIPLQLAVMEHHDPDEPLATCAVLNPSYQVLDGPRNFAWEGCLSADGLRSIVPRVQHVKFTALHAPIPDNSEVVTSADFAAVEWELTGWPARIVQHETDHLFGTICHDLSVPRSMVMEEHVFKLGSLAEVCRRLNLEGDVVHAAENNGDWA